ncbi:hypothetical protein Tco_0565093 [Tanacetum coccineum]
MLIACSEAYWQITKAVGPTWPQKQLKGLKLSPQSCPTDSSDKELEGPMKDQPLSADASPTTLSPGYIADSNPEEDKEDPEEDPADHPADG